jgi:hypothetical protein
VPGGTIAWLQQRIREAHADDAIDDRRKAMRIDEYLSQLPEREAHAILPELGSEILFRLWCSLATAGMLFGAGVRQRDRLHAILKERGRWSR